MILKETPILTSLGFRQIEDFDRGQWLLDGLVFNPSDETKKWGPNSVDCSGPAKVRTYTLIPYNAPADGYSVSLTLPRPCGVVLAEGVTWDLRHKDRVVVNSSDVGYDAMAWGHGFMMACKTQNLANLDIERYPLYRDKLTSLIDTKQLIGNPVLPHDGGPSAKGSWIRGYLSADGFPGEFTTSSREHLDFFLSNHLYAGLVQTSNPKTERRFIRVNGTVNFYDEHSVHYAKGSEFQGYRVADIAEGEEQWAYSVYTSHSYVTSGGVILLSDI